MSDDLQMAGKVPTQQAAQAIKHVLTRIREEEPVAYHLGYGTQSFALLTEAFASLTGEPIEKVRAWTLGEDVE